VAIERLSRTAQGTIRYALKTPYRDGTTLKSLDSGKSLLAVCRKSLDDGLTPSFSSLPLHNRSADIPIELNQLPVDGERRLDLRGPTTALDVLEQRA